MQGVHTTLGLTTLYQLLKFYKVECYDRWKEYEQEGTITFTWMG